VDNTLNKAEQLQFYTDLQVRTGTKCTAMRFFLTDLEEHKAILGYPWFAATQPNIDWKRGWLDHRQLPVVIHVKDAQKAIFVNRHKNTPQPIRRDRYFAGTVTIHPSERQGTKELPTSTIPAEYQQHQKVFDKEWS
jgi:hypothetical protein